MEANPRDHLAPVYHGAIADERFSKEAEANLKIRMRA
jgi:hypothetical protein